MYPVELDTRDTTESNTSASYLDLLLSIVRDGYFHTSINDKCDDFNFYIKLLTQLCVVLFHLRRPIAFSFHNI